MKNTWQQFLLFRLPCAFLLVALTAEFFAFLVSKQPQIRHPLDKLLVTMQQQTSSSNIVLLGDSVTQDAAAKYALAPTEKLANLTTNQASGLVGSLLLLKRYLAVNKHTPLHVLVAATPEFLTYTPKPHTAAIYLTSIFTQPEEVKYLSRLGIKSADSAWKPAILDLESQVFNKLVGYVIGLSVPKKQLDLLEPGKEKLEGPGGNEVKSNVLISRQKNAINLTKQTRQVIADLCHLSDKHQFLIHFIWAPTPESVYRIWRKESRIENLQSQIIEAAESNCPRIRFDDMNKAHSFPDYAFRDPDHLRRPGWVSFYATLLKNFITSLKDQRNF